MRSWFRDTSDILVVVGIGLLFAGVIGEAAAVALDGWIVICFAAAYRNLQRTADLFWQGGPPAAWFLFWSAVWIGLGGLLWMTHLVLPLRATL